jgi:DNA-directed RNA polymerase specialized sigma24 family protein
VERAGKRVDDDVDAEASLVDRARLGDRAAWQALVERHIGLVRAICQGYGLRPDAAAEVNQLVWLRLVEHLPRIRTPDAIGGWIAATARAHCLSPRQAATRSGYTAADVGVSSSAVTVGGPGRGPLGWAGWSGVSVPPAVFGSSLSPSSTDSGRLASAFVRIGAHCQRLLRLAAITPRPAAEHISAALDLAVDDVEPACGRCLDRLCRLVAADSNAVLAELQRTVAGTGAVPDGWWDDAWSAHAWLALDAAPAERVYTVLGRDTVPNGRWGPREVRQVRFSAPHDGVEVAIDTKGDEVVLSGQLSSRRAVAVTARWPGGERTARTDEGGAFRFHGLPLAPLCVQVGGDHPLKTGWILP